MSSVIKVKKSKNPFSADPLKFIPSKPTFRPTFDIVENRHGFSLAIASDFVVPWFSNSNERQNTDDKSPINPATA